MPMFVHVNTTPNSPRKSVQVRESRRIGTQVKSVIVRSVGIALNDIELEKLKQLGETFITDETEARNKQLSLLRPNADNKSGLRGRPRKKTLSEVVPPSEVALTDIVEEKRIQEGLSEVGGYIFEQLGYGSILEKKADRELLKDLVLERIAQPASKHKTQRMLQKHQDKIYDLDRIYRMMDKLYKQIELVKSTTFTKTAALFPGSIDIVFFDVTTLYFESIESDELRSFGYSKDHRFNTTQVVLALATNSDGLPIGYELFEGNKAEVSTLKTALENWKKLFSIKSVCFVGDRAMFCDSNLGLLEQEGYHYVIAAKLKTLPGSIKQRLFDERNYRPQVLSDDLAWISEHTYKERRLIVSYKRARALNDKKERQTIIDKIAMRIGQKGKTERLISNRGIKKYTSTNKAAITQLDQEKIDSNAQWDGLHGVITNIKDLGAIEILGRYARLWVIEDSFRINKHTLAMRPIFHFKPERIKAHIALCYMAFATLRHLQYQVNLMQKISAHQIIEELTSVQASIYVHKRNKDRYRVPGAFSQTAARIYRCLNLVRKLDAEPYVN
jgi:transposase